MSNQFTEVERLQQRVCDLERENDRLRIKVKFFEDNPKIAAGIRGEILIAEMLDLARTTGNASYDLEGCCRIEVKYSRLAPVSKKSPKSGLRWTWGSILGSSGRKDYGRLILLGEADPAHCASYLDPACPYVLFDIPRGEVRSVITKGGTSGDHIRLNSNPKMARSKAKVLYPKYQVTQEILKQRYRMPAAHSSEPVAESDPRPPFGDRGS